MAPFFLIPPECFSFYILAKSISIFQVKSSYGTQQREGWPLFRRRLELSQKVGAHIPHLQHKAAATLWTKSQPPPLSEVWHWKWYSGNKITRGPEIFLYNHNKKQHAVWCFQVRCYCFRSQSEEKCFGFCFCIYFLICQHAEVFFGLVGVLIQVLISA